MLQDGQMTRVALVIADVALVEVHLAEPDASTPSKYLSNLSPIGRASAAFSMRRRPSATTSRTGPFLLDCKPFSRLPEVPIHRDEHSLYMVNVWHSIF